MEVAGVDGRIVSTWVLNRMGVDGLDSLFQDTRTVVGIL